MKKILFFSTLLAVCCAFAVVNVKKPALEVAPKNAVPPTDEYGLEDPYWAQNDTYLEQEKVKGKATFAKLLEQFPKGTLPYSLTANILRNDVDTMAHGQYRNRQKKVLPRELRVFFPSLESEGNFSRMPPPPPEPFLAFEAEGKHVLIYLTERYDKRYTAATFDENGKLIGEKPFALVKLNMVMDATLDEQLNLTSRTYKVVWDKESDMEGYKNRKITDLALTSTTVESLIKKNSRKEIKAEKTVQRATP